VTVRKHDITPQYPSKSRANSLPGRKSGTNGNDADVSGDQIAYFLIRRKM
jgi:hypothetical protein